ncbi:uncharacterized protein DUF4837 [Breznakibacter xylanolyticus]|uniref:Uncharacterized protein DUF4837 n=1 Tax=Breznakibacter xylanolyticus TaxID=990 RepID=A0A2W7NG94_9BACT|nr:DUF4837 family protein [Breznakibacter xylanolyticus]PZX10302.1 uncharacterized protein DUF4837 [Breznakibacter xylanolyticus]
MTQSVTMPSLRYPAIALLFAALLMNACKSDPVKRSPQGTTGDMLIVMDDTIKASPAGQLLQEFMTQPMLGLPQEETLFTLSVAPHRVFGDQMKASRNIVVVEQNNANFRDTIIYHRDYWASNQAVVNIYGANSTKMHDMIKNAEIKLLSYFLKSERDRSIAHMKKYPHHAIVDQIKTTWGKSLVIPNSFKERKMTPDFTWVSHETDITSLGIFIYQFDWVGDGTFSKEYLLNKRDSILQKNVPGPEAGSYMGTEFQFPIIYKQFTLNNEKVAEIRGLWKVVGDMMGGPFISHAHYDPTTNKVTVTEGYVYSPEKPNKRNFIWQAEAILYTYAPANKQLSNP